MACKWVSMGRWIPVSNIKGIHLTYLILCLSEAFILKSSIGGVFSSVCVYVRVLESGGVVGC